MPSHYSAMTKAELIAALRAVERDVISPSSQLGSEHAATAADAPTRLDRRERALLRKLQTHQIELEVQNRALRESQAALEEARSRYADLYDFAPVGYLTLDVEARVLGANLTALSICGLSSSPVGSLFWSAVPITSKQALLEHLQACAASKEAVQTALTVRRKRATHQVLELRTSALRDPTGQLVGFRTVFSDVTQAKHSEQLMRFLVQLSEQLAGSLDPATTLATVVRAAVPLLADICIADLRKDTGELCRVDVAFAQPVSASVRERLMRARDDASTPHAAVLEDGEPTLIADARLHRSATVQACPNPIGSIMYVPMAARGRNLGVLTLISAESARTYCPTDLTLAEDVARRAAMAIDNAELYEQAQRAILLRETVLAVASHDLKNPLYAIGITADTLLDYGAISPEALLHHLTSIKRSASQMERLIEDLLDLSSIRGGRLALALQTHNTQDIDRDFMDVAETLVYGKGRALKALFAANAGALRVDRDRILQVFANLLGNAIKFTPENGTISIGSELRDAGVYFYVTDTGPGIAFESVARVFDAYWQAGGGVARGHGLGLYIARGIVEAHGGTIGVNSHPGAGSTFFFTLPFSHAATAGQDLHWPEHAPPESAASSPKPAID